MRVLIFVAICLSLTACSRYLEVRVFNASGGSLTVCSFDQMATGCIELPNGCSTVLKWRSGTFVVQVAGCSAIYHAPVIESLDEFRVKPQEPVNAVINGDRLLLLVRNGLVPEEVTAAGQPAGFPVAAFQQQAVCK